MTKKHNLYSAVSNIFPVVFFAGIWIMLIGLTYYTAGNILDADASNVLVLSNFLAQNNAIASTGWRYFTELHILNMQIVYAFYFHLFESWRLVRVFGAVTLQLIFVCSYWYLFRQAKISTKAFFYSAAFLLIPVSVTYTRIVLVHAHYTFHISLAFLLIGLMIKLSRGEFRAKGYRVLALVVYGVLPLLSGANGMRQFYISIAPACFVSLYWYIRSNEMKSLLSAEGRDRAELKQDFLRSLTGTQEGRSVLYAFGGAIVNMVGIATNLFVLRKFFGFSTYYSMQTFAPKTGAFNGLLNDFLNLLGYRDGAKLFSVEGVASLFAVASLVVILAYSVWYLFRAGQMLSSGKRIVAIMFIGALLFQSLVFLITENYYIHYYTPVYVYLALIFALMIDDLPQRNIRIPRIFAGLMMFGFIVSGFITTNYLVNRPEQYATKYEGLTYNNIDQVDQIRPAAEYLKEHGYTYGYSYYWDSSIVTELTDGAVEVCAVVEPPDITYSYANTKKAFWDINYHSGKTFFLFHTDSTDAETYTILSGGKEVYRDAYYKIYEYPAPISFERSPFSD